MSTPRVPFVIGITGNTDPIGYGTPEGEVELKKRIADIFKWVRSERGSLNPGTGKFDPSRSTTDQWRALGMKDTPLLVLSSLAPGADTLVAEVALEHGIEVRAPLPFPPDINGQSSSFRNPADLQRYNDLVPRCDAYGVALDNDLEDDPTTDLTALDVPPRAPTSKTNPKRSDLRYRAAGEHVAAHSDLLIALHDPRDLSGTPDDYYAPGTTTIVATKRRGLSFELLAMTNNFSWADNGPVLHIPWPRTKHDPAAGVPTVAGVCDPGGAGLPSSPDFSQTGPTSAVPGTESTGSGVTDPGYSKTPHFRLLHPEDLCTVDDPDGQRAGDDLFRRIIGYQEEFNRMPPSPDEPSELAKLAGPLSPDAAAHAAGLDTIARLRRRAASESRSLDEQRTTLLRRLLWAVAIIGTAWGAYEHQSSTDFWTRLPQLILLGITLLGIGITACLYHDHLVKHKERRRFDARAIGEGLRVQFYWLLAGMGKSVSADYMQRQRGELDWIRYVIASVSFPYVERWQQSFERLRKDIRTELLRSVQRIWVHKQIGYFRDKVIEHEEKLLLWQTLGWHGIAIGLINVVAISAAEFFPEIEALLLRGPGIIYLLAAAITVEGIAWLHPVSATGHIPVPLTGWLFGRPSWGMWGRSLLISVCIIALTAGLTPPPGVWPGPFDTWVILASTALLLGGLCFAWAEKKLYAEESRSYRAMGQLFHSADTRLEPLLDRYAAATDAKQEAHLLLQIHFIYHQLGCEALNENAEWLILHRARPLEPFTP